MWGNREQMRQQYRTAWEKYQQQLPLSALEALLVEVMQEHPEYHALWNAQEALLQSDFAANPAQVNPFLHVSMHLTLREQASIDQPPGVRDLHQRLCARHGRLQAEHRMMECLGPFLQQLLGGVSMPEQLAAAAGQYLECLRRQVVV